MKIIKLLLFPEYIIYKSAQNQEKFVKDYLMALVAIWILLKVGVTLMIALYLLTPFRLGTVNWVVILASICSILAATSLWLKRKKS